MPQLKRKGFGIHVLTLIMVMLLPTGPVFSDPVIQEDHGKISDSKEVTSFSFMPSSMTFGQCLTEQEMAPQQEDTGGKCEATDKKIPGDTINWTYKGKGSEKSPVAE